MTDMLTEEEQIIALKEWWKKYGVYIVIGIVSGIIFYFAWSMWHTRSENARASAGYEYQMLVDALLNNDAQTAQGLVESEKYVQLPMPYGYVEKLIEAEMYVQQSKWDAAASSLQQAQVIADDAFFHQLVSVRLARIYLAQGKAQEALDLLSAQSNTGNAEIYIVKGNAYQALNDNTNATIAYKEAWDALPSFSPQRQLVAMMLADVPGE